MVVVKEHLPGYGREGRRDIIDEEGNIVYLDGDEDFDLPGFDERDILDEPHFEPFISIERGVFMSLGERALILTKLAKFYANQARAGGADRARHSIRYRDGLVTRYGSSGTDDLANRMVDRAEERAPQEDVLIGRLLMKHDLVQAGFDANEIDADAERLKIELQNAIGTDVGARARNKVIKGLYDPTL